MKLNKSIIGITIICVFILNSVRSQISTQNLSGKNINTIEFSKNHPIHTLGVGPIHTDQDIEIQDIILPNILDLGDTVNINIRINTRITTDIQSNFKIINVFHKQIYFERMFFEKGNHLKSITLKIPTDMINGLNVASIDPIKNEVQINNNTFSFIGNLENSVDNILMISGALSSNSRMSLSSNLVRVSFKSSLKESCRSLIF